MRGAFIGKGGENVKMLRDKLDCIIDLDKPTGQVTVTVIGEEGEAHDAREEVPCG